MNDTDLQPVRDNQRIHLLDILRGWALLGVVLMNYRDFYFFGYGAVTIPTDRASGIIQTICNLVFAAKSWTLLSFLFGYGFSVLMARLAQKSVYPIAFFSRRMFWLLILSVVNSAFFFGDILKDYAVLGMILLVFYRSSARTAFILSILLFLTAPVVTAWVMTIKTNPAPVPYALYASHSLFDVLWFGFVGTVRTQVIDLFYAIAVHQVMLCCFFLGMAAQRVDFFQRVGNDQRLLKRIWRGSLISLAVLYTGLLLVQHLGVVRVFAHFNPLYWIVLTTMLFIASSLCRLYLAGMLKRFFAALEVIGKMTLTNYMMQNLIGLLLFSGFGLGLGYAHKLVVEYYLALALIVYIAQVWFSRWWLSKYHFGPVEWIWRQLSYGKKIEIKRAPGR